jgi:heterodisulfide reductase subunit C
MLSNLGAEVLLRSNQRVELCYQCHKCTAGCPVVEAMEYGPDRILRMTTLGQEEAVLKSHDIWLCAGCLTCGTRCPNEIDISAVMDALRQIAVQEGYPAAERDALLFHRLFNGVVHRTGRSYEAGMLGLFKILSKTPLMDDVGAGIGLFMRGRVPLLPDRTKAASEVRQIWRRLK